MCGDGRMVSDIEVPERNAGVLEEFSGSYASVANTVYVRMPLVTTSIVEYPRSTSMLNFRSLYLRSYQDNIQQTGTSKYFIYAGVFQVSERWVDTDIAGTSAAQQVLKKYQSLTTPFTRQMAHAQQFFSFDFSYGSSRGNMLTFGGNCKSFTVLDYKDCGTSLTNPPNSGSEPVPQEFMRVKTGCNDYRGTGSSCDELTNYEAIVKVDFYNDKGQLMLRAGASDCLYQNTPYCAMHYPTLTAASTQYPEVGKTIINGEKTQDYFAIVYYAYRMNGPITADIVMMGNVVDTVRMGFGVCASINSLRVNGICYSVDMENSNPDVVVGGYPLNENTMLYQGANYIRTSAAPPTTVASQNFIECVANNIFGFQTNHPKVSQMYLARVSESSYIGSFSKLGKCDTVYYNTTSDPDSPTEYCDGHPSFQANIVEYSTFFSQDETDLSECVLRGDAIHCDLDAAVMVEDCSFDADKSDNVKCSNRVTDSFMVGLGEGDVHYTAIGNEIIVNRGAKRNVKSKLMKWWYEMYVRAPWWTTVLTIAACHGLVILALYYAVYMLAYILSTYWIKRWVLRRCYCKHCGSTFSGSKGQVLRMKTMHENLHRGSTYEGRSGKWAGRFCCKCVTKSMFDTLGRPINEQQWDKMDGNAGVDLYMFSDVKRKSFFGLFNRSNYDWHMSLHRYHNWNWFMGKIRVRRSEVVPFVVKSYTMNRLANLITGVDASVGAIDVGWNALSFEWFAGVVGLMTLIMVVAFSLANVATFGMMWCKVKQQKWLRGDYEAIPLIKSGVVIAMLLCCLVPSEVVANCDGKGCYGSNFDTNELRRSGNHGQNITLNWETFNCDAGTCDIGQQWVNMRLVEGNVITMTGTFEGESYSSKYEVRRVEIDTTCTFEYMSTEMEVAEKRLSYCCNGKVDCSDPDQSIYQRMCGKDSDAYTTYNMKNMLKSLDCPMSTDCVALVGKALWLSAACIFNSGGITSYASYSPKIVTKAASAFECSIGNVRATLCDMLSEENSCFEVSSEESVVGSGYLSFIGIQSALPVKFRIAVLSDVGSPSGDSFFMDPPPVSQRSTTGPFAYRMMKKSTGGVCYKGSSYTGGSCQIDRSGGHPTMRCRNYLPKVTTEALARELKSLHSSINCNPENSEIKWLTEEIPRSVTINGKTASDSQTYTSPSLDLKLEHCRLGSVLVTTAGSGLKVKRVGFEGELLEATCSGEWNRNGLARLDFRTSGGEGLVEVRCRNSVAETCVFDASKETGCNTTVALPFTMWCEYGNGKSVYIDCMGLELGENDLSGGGSVSSDEEHGTWPKSVLGWFHSWWGWVIVVGAVLGLLIITLLLVSAVMSMRRYKFGKDE